MVRGRIDSEVRSARCRVRGVERHESLWGNEVLSGTLTETEGE